MKHTLELWVGCVSLTGYEIQVFILDRDENGDIVQARTVYRNFVSIPNNDYYRKNSYLDGAARSVRRSVKTRIRFNVSKKKIRKSLYEGSKHLQRTGYVLKEW